MAVLPLRLVVNPAMIVMEAVHLMMVVMQVVEIVAMEVILVMMIMEAMEVAPHHCLIMIIT